MKANTTITRMSRPSYGISRLHSTPMVEPKITHGSSTFTKL